jgi:prepilin-type N-terminal cleavage/methylation domain-containing protein
VRAGVTLVELLVVLVILSVATGLTTIALRSIRPSTTLDAQSELRALRGEAIRTGVPVTRALRGKDGIHLATALADGRILVDSVMQVDLTATSSRDATR